MFNLPSPLQVLNHPIAQKYGVDIFIKRDDLIHPEISGNKWRKLKFNIEKYHQNKYDAVLTFGGAYSNHIAATAASGQLLKIPTIGIIRGDELTEHSNATLKNASEQGMKLVFVSREKYRERYERIYHEELRSQYGNVLIVDEGGANFHGVLGCAEILKEIEQENNLIPDYIYTASGTGTTAAGLLLSASEKTKIVSVPVFKNGGFIANEVSDLLKQFLLDENDFNEKINAFSMHLNAHFGGYGKYNTELIDFINSFYSVTKVKLDQIYTAKMMFALFQDLEANKIEKESKIVVLHTGGLQGLSSIKDKLDFSF